MIAKRNAEVARAERAGAGADEGRRQARRARRSRSARPASLPAIRSSPGSTTTRPSIYNRERWRVAEVDPGSGASVLVGIDTRGRVCVDSDYLGRVRPRDGGPALEHAYAATTYQAQGATVDRAYVMADPSMDRQEFYVATSRSREETYLYATPEIDFERDEYAPRSPAARGPRPHRRRRPSATAPRSPPTTRPCGPSSGSSHPPSLPATLRELRSEAGAEHRNEERHLRAEADIERHSEQLEGLPLGLAPGASLKRRTRA